jgi:hypothetical protein
MEEFKMKRCKMCGKKIKGYNSLNIEYQFGYGSKHDGDSIECRLCNECADKLTNYLISVCKNNPIVERR